MTDQHFNIVALTRTYEYAAGENQAAAAVADETPDNDSDNNNNNAKSSSSSSSSKKVSIATSSTNKDDDKSKSKDDAAAAVVVVDENKPMSKVAVGEKYPVGNFRAITTTTADRLDKLIDGAIRSEQGLFLFMLCSL